MTPDECQRILRELAATWPKSDRNAWTDEEVVVWLKTLAPLELRDALDALDGCREACKWLPAHAEFRGYAVAVKRRRNEYEETKARLELTRGDPTEAEKTTAREHLAHARALLARPADRAGRP